MYFYDTCGLLNDLERAFDNPFVVCNISLGELEDIKNNIHKDEAIKAKARHLLRLLYANQNKYTIFNYSPQFQAALSRDIFPDTNDSRIIAAAVAYQQYTPTVFRTDDLSCAFLAQQAGLKIQYGPLNISEYKGYKKLTFNSEDETAEFYGGLQDGNVYNLYNNQYLFIKVQDQIIDTYKCVDGKYQQVKFPCFESKMLGKIKPKDEYQKAAMDALKHHKLVALRGPAGTGKSFLAMGYLFDCLEHGVIDKIIVFCNTVATAGAARLGFYPGSRDEKLLDSQIGNFLASKLGGMDFVKALIDQEKLILLPMSDIRGYDTTGMHAGIYITEAQNLDIELMRLALQRVGDDSICILDGDDNAQVDSYLYAGARNGLRRMSEVFRGQDFYAEVTLKNIHRSKIAAIAQEM